VSTKPYSITEFDLKSQLAEVRREIQMRRYVYPKWVANGTLQEDDAARRIAAMDAVAETLTGLIRSGDERQQPNLL